MEALWQDLRYGIRMLAKSPGFTAVAVLTLALGIGANSSVFSLINAVLLRPLPFKEPDRLVALWERRESSHDTNLPISGHEFSAWREQANTFENMALTQGEGLNLTGAGDPTTISVLRVSVDYFSVLGVPTILGRTFLPGEDQTNANNIAVLNERLWKQRFGAAPDIINKTIKLNDQSYTIVGVMPSAWVSDARSYQADPTPETWLPINLPLEVQRVGKHSHQIIARLKSGVTIEQAQEDLAAIAARLEEQYPNNNVGHGVQVIPLHENAVGGVRRALIVLFGAVAFVLLIACANVANLLLTRAAARQKEIAIRTALGASRLRLIRQMLTESCVLAAVGGGVGLLLALWIIDLLPRITAVSIPRLEHTRVDGRVLAVTIGLSLLTGIIAGLVPALRISDQNLSQSLNEATRTSQGVARQRIGSLLVVIEVSLALVLLVGGGLMIRSFVRVVRVDPGFDPRNVLRADLSLAGSRYRKPQQQMRFYEDPENE